MIIVKQDKKGIVNFDNITDIYTEKGEDEDRYFIFYIPVCNLGGLDIYRRKSKRSITRNNKTL